MHLHLSLALNALKSFSNQSAIRAETADADIVDGIKALVAVPVFVLEQRRNYNDIFLFP